MSNKTIRTVLASKEQPSIATYSKMPPKLNPDVQDALRNRKTLTPSAVSVNFQGTTQNEKKPVFTTAIYVGSKTLSDKPKSGGSVKAANQNAGNIQKTKEPIEMEKRQKSGSGVVAGSDESSNGIKLVGFKMMNESDTGQTDAWKSKSWTASKLPPCRVCGDDTSPRGLHYGVNTCEACKAFFRRTLKRENQDYQCTCPPEEKRLGTDIARKFSCPKCRYERCIKLGMSKDAIKIGRYTIGRKRQNDQEVKTHEQRKERLNSESSKSSGSPYSTGQSVSSPEEVASDIDNLTLKDPKPVPARSVKKLRRSDGNDPETGMLYRSMTNIIFHSLLKNQTDMTPATPKDDSETTPMEKLFMEPFDLQAVSMSISNSDHGTSQFQFSSSTSIPDSLMPQTFNVTLNSPFSGMGESNTLDSVDYLMKSPENLGAVELSPIENLLMSPPSVSMTTNGNTVQISGPAYTSSQSQSDASPIESLLMSPPSDSSPGSVAMPSPSVSFPDSGFSQSSFSPQSQSEPSTMDSLLVSPLSAPTSDKIHAFAEQSYAQKEQSVPSMWEQDEKQVNGDQSLHEEGEVTCDGNFTLKQNCGMTCDSNTYECDLFDDVYLQNFFPRNEDALEHELEFGKGFEMYQDFYDNDFSVDEMEGIIKKLTELAISQITKFEMLTCSEIKQRHKAYLEQYNAKLSMFGQMKISTEEYMSFYNQTGIDIDNRQQLVIECLKYFETTINNMVKFSRGIPGFNDLDINDQALLLKTSRFEHDMLKFGGQKCILSSLNVATLPWDKEYHVEEIMKVLPPNYCKQKMEAASRVNALQLTVEETCVARALVITYPDRINLKDRDKVEAIQSKLCKCLKYLTNKRPDPFDLNSLISVVMELRHLAAWDLKNLQDIFEVWPVAGNHQLVKEFVTF
ncbi:nuclear hormone receptor HR96-like [Mya arenaria]|uniref:nuclear hormone receptor HR96-like n=1 Tax=Mya arenaria TaxID=6604 RepID=UPI0022E67CA2|nr:nuclear hormone receptor HR96-like [Mya arenaria]XP_052763799.1 nuclear hormone receptor HR96-like [Mya arenaria]